MFAPQQSTLRWALLAILAVAPGCANFWDDITARDFSMTRWWSHDDPLKVLADEKQTDGWKRAKAIAALSDPKTPEDREAYFKILSTAALTDKQPMCRLAAVKALGQSKDPRAPKVLEDVYLQRLPYTPELAKVVRQQALASLEDTGEANARALFIRVARQPGADAISASADHLQTLDERLAAIRALSKYPKQQDVIDTLVHLMETDRDVAIRSRAWDSLKHVTDKDLPNDAKVWREMFATGKEPPKPTIIEKAAAWTPNLEMHRPQFLPRDPVLPKLFSGDDKEKKKDPAQPAAKDGPANPTADAAPAATNSSPSMLSRINPFRSDTPSDATEKKQPGPLRRLFQGEQESN